MRRPHLTMRTLVVLLTGCLTPFLPRSALAQLRFCAGHPCDKESEEQAASRRAKRRLLAPCSSTPWC